MGDEDDRRFALELVDRLRELLGGLGVEVARGFVEDEELRLLEEGAGDGDALFLAAGEADAVLAEPGLVALGQLFDRVVDLGGAAGGDDLLEARVRARHAEVVVDGAGEEDGLLRHDAEGLAQLVRREVAQVAAVELDAAVARLIEAEQELRERALSASRRSGDHDEAAGAEGVVEVPI